MAETGQSMPSLTTVSVEPSSSATNSVTAASELAASATWTTVTQPAACTTLTTVMVPSGSTTSASVRGTALGNAVSAASDHRDRFVDGLSASSSMPVVLTSTPATKSAPRFSVNTQLCEGGGVNEESLEVVGLDEVSAISRKSVRPAVARRQHKSKVSSSVSANHTDPPQSHMVKDAARPAGDKSRHRSSEQVALSPGMKRSYRDSRMPLLTINVDSAKHRDPSVYDVAAATDSSESLNETLTEVDIDRQTQAVSSQNVRKEPEKNSKSSASVAETKQTKPFPSAGHRSVAESSSKSLPNTEADGATWQQSNRSDVRIQGAKKDTRDVRKHGAKKNRKKRAKPTDLPHPSHVENEESFSPVVVVEKTARQACRQQGAKKLSRNGAASLVRAAAKKQATKTVNDARQIGSSRRASESLPSEEVNIRDDRDATRRNTRSSAPAVNAAAQTSESSAENKKSSSQSGKSIQQRANRNRKRSLPAEHQSFTTSGLRDSQTSKSHRATSSEGSEPIRRSVVAQSKKAKLSKHPASDVEPISADESSKSATRDSGSGTVCDVPSSHSRTVCDVPSSHSDIVRKKKSRHGTRRISSGGSRRDQKTRVKRLSISSHDRSTKGLSTLSLSASVGGLA